MSTALPASTRDVTSVGHPPVTEAGPLSPHGRRATGVPSPLSPRSRQAGGGGTAGAGGGGGASVAPQVAMAGRVYPLQARRGDFFQDPVRSATGPAAGTASPDAPNLEALRRKMEELDCLFARAVTGSSADPSSGKIRGAEGRGARENFLRQALEQAVRPRSSDSSGTGPDHVDPRVRGDGDHSAPRFPPRPHSADGARDHHALSTRFHAFTSEEGKGVDSKGADSDPYGK